MIRRTIHPMGFPGVDTEEHHSTATTEWADLHLTAEAASVDEQLIVQRSSVSGAMKVVGIMAFGQSALFILLWLWLCASAGASPAAPATPAAAPAPAKKAEFKPEMQVSKYEPKSGRDPFSPVGGYATQASGPSVPLHLEGILYSANEPSAIINGQLVTLHKPTTVDLGSGIVKVEAVKITRDLVVVMVGTEKIELSLNVQNAAPPEEKK